ncbi:MAG: hypothetical protein M1825_003030 [Sarcosagium campestre]|nr:MAG: hypothetical protein M1825_003030 [Sarcosagium campestre]
MSSAGHAPVGQARPLSPSSPPFTTIKPQSTAAPQPQTHDKTSAHPHTPTSPPNAIPITSAAQQQRHSSPNAAPNQTSATVSSQMTSSSSPPSTVAMSTQNSQQNSATTINTFPTPASSVTGHGSSSFRPSDGEDGDGDIHMKNDADDRGSREPNVPLGLDGADEGSAGMEIDEHRRTDHERQGEAQANAGQTDIHRRLGADGQAGLEKDAGWLTWGNSGAAHPRSRPHPTQNLISLYGLDPLAASVARTHPVTGEKQKIRKTYKGKITAFGLSGKDKEVKHAPDQPGGLVEMMQMPDEEWYVQKVAGREVEKGLSDSLLAKLERACYMEPGDLPGFDASVLGLGWEDTVPGVKRSALQASSTTTATTAAASRQAGQSNGAGISSTAAPAASDALRPTRASKKRRYDDRSFEGYGEGFVDDDVDAQGGYSSDDRDDGGRGGKKKRKKVGFFGLSE